MAITILDRPLRSIYDTNGDFLFKSRYNASGGDLPTNYKIGNDLFPISQGTYYSQTAVTNIGGRVRITVSSGDYAAMSGDGRYEVNGWITILNDVNDTYYTGQIVSLDSGAYTILTSIPYDPLFASGSNSITFYPKDYAVYVNVYVANYNSSSFDLIAQKKVTSFVFDESLVSNVTDCNVGGIVKSKLSATYTELIDSIVNAEQHAIFYIETAEVYKRVNTNGENELWSSSVFQSEWVNKQPSFFRDFFNCSSPDLQNEEFATDLSDWTNTANSGNINWVWNAGTAESNLGTSGASKVSQYLQQDYTYTEGARYNINTLVEGTSTFTFNVYKENISGGLRELLYRQVIDKGDSTIISFSFTANEFSRGEAFDRISFRVLNNTTSVNNINVEYFRQAQIGIDCVPILESLFAVRQFGNPTAGSMGDLEGTYDHLGKMLTTYTNKILNPADVQSELSFILNSDMAQSRFGSVVATVTYTDGTINTYYSNPTVINVMGLHRVLLTPIIEGIQQDVLSGLIVSDISIVATSSINNLFGEYTEGTFEDNTGTLEPFGEALAGNLQNEEFTSDLSDWTNVGNATRIDWVWDTGAAQAELLTGTETKFSKFLQQDYSYIEGVQYNIDAEIVVDGNCTVSIFNTSILCLLHSESLTAGSNNVNFSFVFASCFGVPPKIQIVVENTSGVANTVRIEYFRQDSNADISISTSDPYEGLYSAKIDYSYPRAGGFYNTLPTALVGGQTYIFSAWYKFDEFVDNAGTTESTYVFLRVMDSTKTTILAEYREYLSVTEYKKFTLSYTPLVDEDVYLAFGKNLGFFGVGVNDGAGIIYVDNIKIEGPAIPITTPIQGTYKALNSCYTASIKWLNSLGGWDNYTFDTPKGYSREIIETTRYGSDVMGNWDSQFTGSTGSEFEQSIKHREVVTLTTKIIGTELKKTLNTIKTSIHVLMYSEELGKYITVLVDKDSFSSYQEGQNTYKFSFDVLLPMNYVQNA